MQKEVSRSKVNRDCEQVVETRLVSTAGFTRTDLTFTLGTVLLIGVLIWVGINVAGEKSRIFSCAHHLKTLELAFTLYAHDHNDTFPPAVIIDGTNSTTWDREVSGYLDPKLNGANSPETEKALEAKIVTVFKCPSDREPRGGADPRSYSMPIYDINRFGWPPSERSMGGLGLYLDSKIIAKARETDPPKSLNCLPAIKTSIVVAPVDTALLVERISILNALWGAKFACISSPQEQFEAKTFAAKDFHGGKMNYLMADGHVELMPPLQSSGFIGGVWTIRAGD